MSGVPIHPFPSNRFHLAAERIRCTMLLVVIFGLLTSCHAAMDWESTLNLPAEHMAYLFYQRPALREQCLSDPHCPYKDEAETTRCFGYEDGCPANTTWMVVPQCPGDSRKWANEKQQQWEQFWRGGDFGYVKTRQEEMHTYCVPEKEGDSELRCTGHAQMCMARRLYLDLRRLNSATSHDRFREDVFVPGEIGGRCRFEKDAFRALGDHKSPLQSWFAELEHYTPLGFEPDGDNCDLIIGRPTIFMKLDAGINMFHHFCDYVNLYASLHVNGSWLESDVQIVMWDTSGLSYGDFFSETWQAFSKYPIVPLHDWDGKRVCLRDAMFALPPRMRFGLFYNMPLMPGCSGTGLMRAFSQHVLHRLDVTQEGPRRDGRLRVTFLDRKTKFRNVMNQEELLKALNDSGSYEVRVVAYNHQQKFVDQLQSTHNTDIFIGMHGAGLTHLVFLPDWATMFEIYNCDDEWCYLDLSRLRGVPYFTWEKMDLLTQEDEGHHPTLGAHKKFTNYAFDVDEFMRIVKKMAQHVRSHPAFRTARRGQKEEL